VQALQIGPLVLPYILLVAMAAIGFAWLVAGRLARARGIDADPLLWRMLLVGVVAARLAFVWEWRGPYLSEPLSLLDIRDGGWNAPAGLTAACIYGVYRMRRAPQLGRIVAAAVLTTGTIFVVGALASLALPRPGVPLPALSLPSLDQGPVSLAGLAGKPTVLNLWATWCPPCQREMPVLQQAQERKPDINFVFINQGETVDTIHRYLDRNRLQLRNVLVDARLQAGSTLGHRALPTTLFFDARGQLVSTRIGELSHATLAQRIAEMQSAARVRPPLSSFR
jgi:thiol-disulfide isomerase/thioredoxin